MEMIFSITTPATSVSAPQPHGQNFQLERKLVTRMVGGVYILFVLIWLWSRFDANQFESALERLKIIGTAPGASDEIGLVKRAATPDRNRNQREFIAIGDKGIAANPSCIELTGDEEASDLLIGPPLYEFNVATQPMAEVALQLCQQL